ncbi:hypothetical protein NC796_09340 [Aliifodinibius sp. S!AR15-10]|uniref:hypothetical protein n=1 Tax=Aliifodinibius sp. S!AR15-10 TaxID=2950437 RepID=UPI00285EA8F5|nr:hypothetical protein [Aliifodinibius sp. S!AR15-10]MDR8391340.1 hypothetical protein [Aliifodinibius sp. S!AR15-10]
MKYTTATFLAFLLSVGVTVAQQSRELPYFTNPDQTGLNQFEAPFETDIEFDGVNVRIGGANTLQFQALRHENAGPWLSNGETMTLPELGSNFNLATSNLDLDVALTSGVRMHLRTYLSSQHHTETYVKGGYMQVDRLDFISEGLASELMDHLRIKVGHMEINYGDNHFRRSDNGHAIHNPFVGNYIMDSFTTEVGGEVYYYSGDMFAMVGLTNGKLNQSSIKSEPVNKGTFVGKLGYDTQVDQDLRVRITGSIYTTGQANSIYLYDGDRAGSRYYNVLDGGFRSGRFDPGFNNEITAVMINPFVKYKGLEFYGVFENTSGKNIGQADSRTFNQYGAELLYRFGAEEDLYLGGRYNLVSGELSNGNDIDIDRFNIGGGWFLSKNILAKVEYVTQTYDGFSGQYEEGEFDGFMLEAVISF